MESAAHIQDTQTNLSTWTFNIGDGWHDSAGLPQDWRDYYLSTNMSTDEQLSLVKMPYTLLATFDPFFGLT